MPTRIELKRLCILRLKEVKVLYDKKLYDGASYLAGYVIELALKARICKILDSDYIVSGNLGRAFKTHNLEELLLLSGLSNKFSLEMSENRDLQVNWSVVLSWNESFRYLPVGSSSKSDIEDLINAIEDPENGVLTWIKKRW